MTPDTPNSADLLRTAADVFKKELMPLLPEEKKLDALMILSILGSAERELEDLGGLQQRQSDRLADIMPGGGATELCEAIREGAFDDHADATKLHALLMTDVRDRLALVNPKYLQAADKD